MKFLRFFRRERHDAELAQEMRAHIAEETADNVARGMSPDEARRRAYVKFGNPQQVRERVWTEHTILWLDGFWRDLRYTLRTLRRSPGFSLMSIFVMALGIGGTVAMFAVVRNVLLNPLPFPDSKNLYAIYEHDDRRDIDPIQPVAGGNYQEWEKALAGKPAIALISPWQDYNVSSDGGKLPEKIDADWVSSNFLSILRVRPMLGRDFTESDDRSDAPATVILSYSFWVRRYASDRNIVGRNIYLDAKPYTVIGVLPAWFKYLSGAGTNNPQVWTPVRHEAPTRLINKVDDHHFVTLLRLERGTTIAQVVSKLDAVQHQIKMAYPSPIVHSGVIARSMLDDAVQDYKTPLYALLAATCCVLLIACLNVASLLVARVSAQSKEHAIRAALGGSRARLFRERLTESFVLAAAGGGLAVVLANFALRWLVLTRGDINRIENIHVDGGSLLFAAGMVLVGTFFPAIISSFSAERKRLLTVLQEASRSHTGSGARARLRRALLVAEVTLTVMLLVGAGLLLKSYQRLRTTDLGIPEDNVLTLSFSLPQVRYDNTRKTAAFFEQLVAKVRALPGVESAAIVSRAPGQGWGGDNLVRVVEHPPLPKDVALDLVRRGADPGYFAAMHVPLIKGRTFREDERFERSNVTVISDAAAKICFPNGEDPIGKHLSWIDAKSSNTTYEVIGVVGNTRYDISELPRPMWYLPLYGSDYRNPTIMVHSAHDVEAQAIPVQKIVGELDPDLPVFDVMTLRETVAKSTIDSQFDSLLVVAFAVIALLLAAAGLYGVVAYLVTQRTAEIGVRIALGAQRHDVLGLVLGDGLRPALIGMICGLAGSVAAVRLIRSMLYETQPLDPVVFAVVMATLLAMATLACIVPAWKASRLDPMQALRTE